MIELAEKMTPQPAATDLLIPGSDLEKIAEEFIGKHGTNALGSMDTPAFIRKVRNVALMPPQELLKRRTLVEPDPKIAALAAVLKGLDLPQAS